MGLKIIVIDDDPTGSQTVHGCLLLLRWDVETLRLGLRDAAPIFFILANTRSQSEPEAIATTKEVCRNLKLALAIEKIEHYLIVSRSDSTLRGHFPAETEAIASELGAFDACFFAPAFFEGGRITRNGVHYVVENGIEIPVHQTEFAKDPSFGFQSSFLPKFIVEKTQNKVTETAIDCLDVHHLPENLLSYFKQLNDQKYVVLNGEKQADFDQLMPDLLSSVKQGKKFLLRSAASLLTSLANVGQQPIAPEFMSRYRQSSHAGIVFVGSHVQKTTQQLDELLQLKTVQGIEIDVLQCQDPVVCQHLLAKIKQEILQLYQANLTPVLFTTRQVIKQANFAADLKFGHNISSFFVEIMRSLPQEIGFILSKGGNTTNTLLSQGLRLQSIRLLGQILAGCCLVKTESSHPQFPDLPIVLFPGNVGDRHSLVEIYQRLQLQ